MTHAPGMAAAVAAGVEPEPRSITTTIARHPTMVAIAVTAMTVRRGVLRNRAHVGGNETPAIKRRSKEGARQRRTEK